MLSIQGPAQAGKGWNPPPFHIPDAPTQRNRTMEAGWHCFWTDTWADSFFQNLTHTPTRAPQSPAWRAWEVLTRLRAGGDRTCQRQRTGPPRRHAPVGRPVPWETPKSQGQREDRAKPFVLQMRGTEAPSVTEEIRGSEQTGSEAFKSAPLAPAAPQGLLPRGAPPPHRGVPRFLSPTREGLRAAG